MKREQYESIVRRWYDPLYRFALSLCCNSDDALDLTQSAFFKLASKSHTLKDESKIKTWLFSVTHREFIDQYRRSRRFPHYDLDSVFGLPSTTPPPSGTALDARQALDALKHLDDIYRVPLILFYLEDLSYREIASILEIPIGTVMSRLRRGKDRLRKHIEHPEQMNKGKVIEFKKANDG
ncbi:RNA polymerase sigma factor [Rubellicoccus peritrichatus]|uniref:RNA polymerase sigma factor n=1 Tax=Rubellicoccus peritrichatus TaxID=3080537 RepID=A0AAQ3L989_9BACT|nr:RNA polymerase sigma factor [Puniceicoccus sp. CR14]WOO39640.1 RNA polymerase sigma factor [Puniceicoccus sp. CR14]